MNRSIRVLMALRCAASILAIMGGCGPSPPSITKDGGSIIVYEHDDLGRDAAQLRTHLATTIRGRLDPEGLRGVHVKLLENNRFQVSIPGIERSQLGRDQRLIASEEVIRFGVLADEHGKVNNNADNPTQGWFMADANKTRIPDGAVRRTAETGSTEVLVVLSDVSGADLTSCELRKEGGNVAQLQLHFREDASRKMEKLLAHEGSNGPTLHPVIVVDESLYPCSIRSSGDREFGIEGVSQDDLGIINSLARWGQLPVRVEDRPVSIDIRETPK